VWCFDQRAGLTDYDELLARVFFNADAQKELNRTPTLVIKAIGLGEEDKMLSTTEELLQGSIDMHVHHGPDSRERRVDALQAARQAQEVGMRAIVLKSHVYPTAPLAYIISQMIPNVTIFGSISLDVEVGGLNIHALKASANLGAKVVWMPTLSSANDMKKKNLVEEGITILNKEGELMPVVEHILEIVKEYHMVLCTGHLFASEAFALVDKARKKGISKVVITHPLMENFGAHLSLEEQLRMVDMGAFIEHCFGMTMPLTRVDPMTIVEAIKAVGAEHCIMSTDLGQAHNPAPAEGMRMMVATMLRCGLTEKELALMIKTNPSLLLDLD
jgi:hypothetical protein